MDKFIREQEATRHDIDLCIEVIRRIEKEMNKIEEKFVRIKARSLEIDNSLVQIREANLREFDLSALLHVYRTLDRPAGSHTALASNNQFLLTHQHPNWSLIDKEMNIVKQVLWTYDIIWDMCWSSSLNRFVIIEENDIFLVNETTMSIEKLQTNETRKWASCASFDTFLVLSTQEQGASIVKLRLRSSVATVEGWKSFGIREKYERIESIVSNNEAFILMIRDKLEKSLRMELRSRKTLTRIWSLPLNIVCNQDRRFNCCSLRSDEWLVADYETERLLHITRDGKIKTTTPYKAIPYSVTLFNANILVVSRSGGINFHKI
jgi:hypothetical protein